MRNIPFASPMNSHPAFSLTNQRGVSLVEVMVGLAIGLIILAALITLYSNISYANREQFKSAMQIENGRYAMDLLGNDVRLAGYYGEFAEIPATGTMPDPCNVSLLSEGLVTFSSISHPLAYYIQTYPAADLVSSAAVPTACLPWMNSSTLAAGSDILVVRRLDTSPLLAPPTTNTATPVSGMWYAQSNQTSLSLQLGGGTVIDTTMNAKGDASDASFMRKDFSQAVIGSPSIRPLVASEIRRLRVHVYFIAKCRNGSGSNGTCSTGDDTIPTLKRLELTATGGTANMELTPLVEGIEYMKIYLGFDTDKNGQREGNLLSAPASIGDWKNVVHTEIRLLARNVESSLSADTKVYELGSGLQFDAGAPANSTIANYKRHLYTQQIYIINVAGRRETI